MKKNKKIIALILTIIIVISSMLIGAEASSDFKDVNSKKWYSPAVAFAAENGYMKGVGGDLFMPSEPITRAMAATVLYRMSGAPNGYRKTRFMDVTKNAWYTAAVEYCAEKGIVKGVGEGRFAPMEQISRQDLITMIFRYHRLNYAVADSDESILKAFYDQGEIRNYAREAVCWGLGNCIVEGTDLYHFKPQSNANRAQLAQILMNYAEAVVGQDVVKYRMTNGNPYGLRIMGCRLLNQTFFCSVSGLQPESGWSLNVEYFADGERVGGTVAQIPENVSVYRFSGDALSLFASDPMNAGLNMKASIQISVELNGTSVWKKVVDCGLIQQQGEKGIPLYFKGRKTIDCRILLYHEFSKKIPSSERYSVVSTPERFEENMQYLLNNGYTVIPLRAVLEYHQGKRALPEKCVVLTFDDGYLSNYTMIYPLLQKYKLPATIFVTVSTMDGNKDKMTWEQMREMESSGLVDIQSHSWKHEYHDQLSVETLNLYFEDAFKTLDENLGVRKYRFLAYPHGRYSSESIRIAKRTGALMQMTTYARPLQMDQLNLDEMPRYTISYDSDMREIMR